MTDWYDNRVSLHDKREGCLQGLVLAYGIFGEELMIVGRHGKTWTKIVTASSQPLRTFLVVLRTQIGPKTSVDVVVAAARSSELQLQIKLPRLPCRSALHSTYPGALAYRTPAVLNHHDGCNVRSVRESGTVIVDRSAGGCRKLPKCRQTLTSYQRCRHVLKAFEPDDSESTRPGIASERSESQLPINPS
ncbi:hypothetical protein GE21DRAFT_1325936 [Neurospora crassa]|nr:hypothetical protein B24H17.140 [imported] - Neurospora crassa [Neurospora crassa]KHE83553.1 hypothetical protein GE21DRAFT_1325936 [Neurospora crassa]